MTTTKTVKMCLTEKQAKALLEHLNKTVVASFTGQSDLEKAHMELCNAIVRAKMRKEEK